MEKYAGTSDEDLWYLLDIHFPGNTMQAIVRNRLTSRGLTRRIACSSWHINRGEWNGCSPTKGTGHTTTIVMYSNSGIHLRVVFLPKPECSDYTCHTTLQTLNVQLFIYISQNDLRTPHTTTEWYKYCAIAPCIVGRKSPTEPDWYQILLSVRAQTAKSSKRLAVEKDEKSI